MHFLVLLGCPFPSHLWNTSSSVSHVFRVTASLSVASSARHAGQQLLVALRQKLQGVPNPDVCSHHGLAVQVSLLSLNPLLQSYEKKENKGKKSEAGSNPGPSHSKPQCDCCWHPWEGWVCHCKEHARRALHRPQTGRRGKFATCCHPLKHLIRCFFVWYRLFCITDSTSSTILQNCWHV